MEFRVIWEIDIHADTPKHAAQDARAIQLNPDMPATVFDVWDHVKQRMHRVDLSSATGRLETAELTSLRAHLRSLQCAPDLPSDIRDVVSVMLIFLDEEEGFFRKLRSG
jgi:hypothetical protein